MSDGAPAVRPAPVSCHATLLGVPAPFTTAAFFTVIVVTAATLQQIYGVGSLLTLANLMALIWLPLAPILISDALRITRQFLASYEDRLPAETTGSELFRTFIARWRRGWLVFGVPWSIAVTAVVTAALYYDAPWPIRIWAIASFGPLFLISGIGFWGVVVLTRLVKDFAASGVRYEPYHPDRFGGLAAVGSYAVRGALYFSSGALALPLAFEIIGLARNDLQVSAFAYVVTAVFIGFVCAAFVIPVTDVKQLADAERVRVSLEARARLQERMAAYERSPEHNEKLAREIDMCFQMECAEMEKLREYPYDLSVLAELMLAVALPIAVVVIQQLLR